MGEIADAMLDGDLCEGCGVYLKGESFGVPRRCSACRRFDRQLAEKLTDLKVKVACPMCGRKVKPLGLADHTRTVHAAKATGSAT